MVKVVTATELRTKIREVIQTAQFRGEHVIVTVFDKPAVAVIGIDDYRNYLVYRERQHQGQGKERSERLQSVFDINNTLDELTGEKLQVIIEGMPEDDRAKIGMSDNT